MSDPTVVAALAALEAWEDQWFPVARAALRRHHPTIAAEVFLNLAQTEGPSVVLSVSTFLDRLVALADARGGYGKKGVAARRLLESRGLTKKVLGDARDLLEKLQPMAPAGEIPDVATVGEQTKAAEDALWSWYLEWSAIARVAVKSRPLLRELGFLRTTRSGLEEVVEGVEEEGAEPPERAPR